MASDDATIPSGPADQNRFRRCEKCNAGMKTIGRTPCVVDPRRQSGFSPLPPPFTCSGTLFCRLSRGYGLARPGFPQLRIGPFGRRHKPCRSSLAVTKRAPISSPLRQTSEHTRRTSPPAVKARPKSSGTASAPTSRQTPSSETSTIRHSIHGASGAGIRNPGLCRSTRTCLRAPRSLRCLAIVSLRPKPRRKILQYLLIEKG